MEKQDLSTIKSPVSQVSTDGGLGERIKLGSFLGGCCRRGSQGNHQNLLNWWEGRNETSRGLLGAY